MPGRPSKEKPSDEYGEAEAQLRFEQALKGAAKAPPSKKKKPTPVKKKK